MVAVAPGVASPEIEYTSALLTRVLAHLVGTLTQARGIPHITGLARRLVREWCAEIVPAAAVRSLSLVLVEAAIDIAARTHPHSQADTAARYAWHVAADLHAGDYLP